MKFFRSKHINCINPFEPISYSEEVLPISRIKSLTYELFEFVGWDQSKIELVYLNYEASKTTSQSLSRHLKLQLDNKKAISVEERAAFLDKAIKELTSKQQTLATDLDDLIDIGISRSDAEFEKAKIRFNNLQLLDIESKINHTFSESRYKLSVLFYYSKWLENYWESDDDDFVYQLPSGRLANIVNLNAAMTFLGLELATSSALRGEVWATSSLLLDAIDLANINEDYVNTEFESEDASFKARKAVKARHKKTYKIQEFAIRKARMVLSESPELSIRQVRNKILNDVVEFAKTEGQPLSERGEKTVYEWLLREGKSALLAS